MLLRTSLLAGALGSILLLQKIELVASKNQYQYVEWNIDPRCPPDDRRLLQEPKDFEHLLTTNQKGQNDDTNTNNLRGGGPHNSQSHDDEHALEEDHDDVDNTKVLPKESSDVAAKENVATRRDLTVAAAGTTNPVTFNIKLYWKPGYCWQREWYERYWCLQCPGSSCNQDENLWINECNQYDSRQRFEWVQLGIDPTSYQNQGLLKIAGKDLCVEKVSNQNTFQLRPCDDASASQRLVGYHITNPFQLRPYHIDHITDCLTQDHHPKPYEELISEPCYVAQKHRTSYWEVYKPSEALVTLRFPPCSGSLPCSECQGDCTTDSDCAGTLRCYQRGYSNAGNSIPGCAGVPLAHYADYCYDPLRK